LLERSRFFLKLELIGDDDTLKSSQIKVEANNWVNAHTDSRM